MRENPLSLPILSLALQAMLASRLQKALNPQEFSSFLPKIPSSFDKIDTASAQSSWPETIKTAISSKKALKRSNSIEKIKYASPVALQLARALPEALLAAETIKYSLFQSIQLIPAQNTEAQIWHCCTISVDSRGWLSLELSDVGLAIWLEALRLASPIAATTPSDVAKITASGLQAGVNGADLFTVLYSHGRCCSLLGRCPQTGPPRWLIGPELRCQHDTELRLIAALVDTLDYLSASADQPTGTAALQVALQLSQAFEAFCAACRLPWPDSTTVPEPVLEVRLGLIAIVCTLLQILLEQRLSTPAPAWL